ncbi:MAG: carboxypeptidase-like regulatory domain-containing protein [Aeromicrobium sp.]
MHARPRPFTAAVLALLVAVGVLVGVSAPAEAARPQIYGRVTDASTDKPIKTVKVLLFTDDFDYVRQTKVRANGVYQMTSPGPGKYRLQFVDARPAYDTKAYAARLDVPIRVGSSAVQKNVRLHRGGAIGGTIKVKVKGRTKGAKNALIRAVGQNGQVIEVNANKKGEYALAGLGEDTYRVFAYDSAKRRVGKSKVIKKVKLRSWRKVSFVLKTKPGTIRGFVRSGGSKARGNIYVTAVNKKTGEYWVKKVSAGNLSLRGLTAGSYRLQVPTAAGYVGDTFNIGKVRAGRTKDVTIYLKRS